MNKCSLIGDFQLSQRRQQRTGSDSRCRRAANIWHSWRQSFTLTRVFSLPVCQILPKGVVSVIGPASSPASGSTISHICGEKEVSNIWLCYTVNVNAVMWKPIRVLIYNKVTDGSSNVSDWWSSRLPWKC